MIINPKINQDVQVWYRKEARHFPYHGKYGRVFATSSGKPRNIGVIIEGVKVIVPCGNLREPKDANGKTPAKRTATEKRWHENVQNGQVQKRFYALSERQQLSLEDKIRLSQKRIREWYDAWDGRVAVSYSGGKDSAVLLWLARSVFPDIPAVFVNTGLEYPELVAQVKQTPNTIFIKPKMSFYSVVRTYGYPVISKKVARGISILRHPTATNKNIYRLYDQGINRFGEKVSGYQVPRRWRFLVDSPFEISDSCCRVMKKDPMHAYSRRTGNMMFVGILAEDSKQRQKTYLRRGCNDFDAKTPSSWPMAFWTRQDVLTCIQKAKIKIPSVYGDIITDKRTGELTTTGLGTTGCMFCAFGIQMERNPNRFQQMRETHPALWRYINDKLNLGYLFEYIRGHCPDRKVASKFHTKPRPVEKQLELF